MPYFLIDTNRTIVTQLKNIQAPIQKELSDFDAFFNKSFDSDIPLLKTILQYFVRNKGKQVRPMFVFLVAKMFGELNRSSFNAATSIELLHSATLVHDDVIDVAYERRGVFSLNALWKNKITVLVGDYMLAQGLNVATREKEYEMLGIIAAAVQDTSKGELLQHKKSRNTSLDELTYMKVIGMKTGAFIRACFEVGAFSTTRSMEIATEMGKIGMLAGQAFQIKDDLLDYSDSNLLGKPNGTDIKEGKVTLPMIYALQQASAKERYRIERILKSKRKRKQCAGELVLWVEKKGGIRYAEERLKELVEEAKIRLQNYEQTDAREALIHLFDYMISRKK